MQKYSVKKRMQLLQKVAQTAPDPSLKKLQQLLKDKKFDPSLSIDGLLGPKTQQAINNAKQIYKLPPSASYQQIINAISTSIPVPSPQTSAPSSAWESEPAQNIFDPNYVASNLPYNPSEP